MALPLFASVACLDLLKAATRKSPVPWIEYMFMVGTNKWEQTRLAGALGSLHILQRALEMEQGDEIAFW